MIARHKISGANVMKGLEFTKNGRRLVTNSSDRTIRQFTVPSYAHLDGSTVATPAASSSTSPQSQEQIWEHDLEPTHRFNDPIQKTAWHTMSYSPDGEWLAGGAADSAAHKIYIWDLSNDGQFVSALDGGREPLTHVHVRSWSLLWFELLILSGSGTLRNPLPFLQRTWATSTSGTTRIPSDGAPSLAGSKK